MDLKVSCKTREQAIKLLNYLHYKGYYWRDDTSLLDETQWDIYMENTVYCIHSDDMDVSFGDLTESKPRYTYEQIKFEDFEFEAYTIHDCVHNYDINLCSSKEHGLDCSSCYHLGGNKLPNAETVKVMQDIMNQQENNKMLKIGDGVKIVKSIFDEEEYQQHVGEITHIKNIETSYNIVSYELMSNDLLWEKDELELLVKGDSNNDDLPPLFIEQVIEAKKEESEPFEFKEDNSNNDSLTTLIDMLETNLKTATVLNTFHIGITLQVLKDRLWDIDSELAQKCTDLSRQILGGK